MSIVLPDPRLEHPGLLIPGRKPTCPVVIDWSHHLAKGLTHLILFQPDAPIDLVTGQTLFAGGDPLWTPDGVYFDEVDDYYRLSNVTLNSRCSIVTNPDFSGYLGTLYKYFISFKGFAAANSLNWYLYEYSTATPGRLRLVNDDSASYAADINNYYPSNNGSQIAAVVDGSVLRQYVNGVLGVEISGSGGIANGTADDLHIGQRSDGDTGRRFGGKLPYVMVYGRRALSAHDVHALNANPYQFLIPA